MLAVNKDYNSYFKVIKPEVEISVEGIADAQKVAAILMKQGYVVTMYRDTPEMDVYCIYATYVGENGYELDRMAAFIDTSAEIQGEDVFPDDAKQLEADDDKVQGEDTKTKEGSYYYLGYSDGQFDYKSKNNYDNSKFDDDEYVRGYDNGWTDADFYREEPDEREIDGEDDDDDEDDYQDW